MNFGIEAVLVPAREGELVLATHPSATACEQGGVRVAARGGALVFTGPGVPTP